MTDKERKTELPLHLDMSFEEAMERYAQTNPAEVEPPKGKKPKVAKAGRLASLRQQRQEPKDNKRPRNP